MTREEAKHIVDVAFNIPQAVRRIGEDRTYQEDEIKEAKEMAIKALEQEPILDKIRTEIEQLPRYGAKFPNRYLTVHVDIYEVLQIIDKYRGES